MALNSSPQPSPRRWQRLLHPSCLAGVISVGVHGVLFAAGPSFNGFALGPNEETALADARRQVPLVELSPEEQARLPDFSNRFYAFDNFDNFDNLDDFDTWDGPDPLEPSPGSQAGQTTAFRSSESADSTPPPAYTSPFRLPFTTTPLIPQPQPLPAPPPVGSESPTQSPSTPPTPEEPRQPDRQSAERPEATPTTPPPQTTAALPDEPSAADLAPLPATPTRESETVAPPEIAVRPAPTDEMTLEERLQAYTYDAAQTTDEAAQAELDTWLAAARDRPEIAAEITLRDPVTIPMDYGQHPCLANEPHSGRLGLLVSAGGQPLGEPVLLKSTGYPFINQQAAEFIQTLDFSATTAPTAYQFDIVVDYDADRCTDLGLSTAE